MTTPLKSALRRLQVSSGLDRLFVRLLANRLRGRIVPPPTYYKPEVTSYYADGIRWQINPSKLIEHMVLSGTCLPTVALALDCVRKKSGATTVLDVGANIGQFALPLAKRISKEISIHSFEPNPEVHSVLSRHIEANRLDSSVRAWEFALGASEGHLQMSVPDRNLGAGSLVRDYSQEDSKTHEIQIRSLDEFLTEQQLPPVAFIKVDVEGFEKEFVSGAIKTLKRDTPVLLIETNDENLRHVKATLAPLGYDHGERRGMDVLFRLLPT